MCGRAYSTYTEEEIKYRYANKKKIKVPDLSPNFNFCPTQTALVLTGEPEQLEFNLFHWGYIPPWEPEFKTKLSTINAKSETIFESRLYKSAVMKRRCIVPLSGFIEWKRTEDKKRPYAIHLKDEPIMSVAGIWTTWREGTKEEKHSFAILTTSANSMMEKIHDRMPVILDAKQEQIWMDPELQDEKKLTQLFKPCPSKWLTSYEISTLVNSPRNNHEDVLKPVASG